MRHTSIFLAAVLLSSIPAAVLVACGGGSSGGGGGSSEDGGLDGAVSTLDGGGGGEGGLGADAGGDAAVPPLPAVSLDVVNVGLDGTNAPFAVARRPKLFADIAARTSDVMCVFGAADLTDRNAIAAAAATSFPNVYTITTTGTTAPSNPADAPPALTAAPCGGSVSSSSVNNLYGCVDQNCSTVSGGDPSGTGDLDGTTACVEQSCTTQLLPLYSAITAASSPAAIANDACFDCTFYNFITTGETLGQGQQACATAVAQPFAFAGQAPAMILSRHPIVSSASYILPSTGFRRQVLKAQVQLTSESVVDVFCAQLTNPRTDGSLPYTGSYGSDVAADGGAGNGWEDEQDLQAKEAIAWIEKEAQADGVPALIGADLEADAPPAVGSDAGVDSGTEDAGADSGADASDDAGVAVDAGAAVAALTALSPEVVTTFSGAQGVVPWTPTTGAETCDYCPAPQNVYDTGPAFELLHAYLLGTLPAGATLSETLWGTSNTEVTITALPDQPAPAGGTGPILEAYGHTYSVTVP